MKEVKPVIDRTPPNWAQADRCVGLWALTDDRVLCSVLSLPHHKVSVWEVEVGSRIASLVADSTTIGLAFCGGTQALVQFQGGRSGRVWITDIRSKQSRTLLVGDGNIACAALSPCGRSVVYSVPAPDGSHELVLADIETGVQSAVGPGSYAEFSPNGKELASIHGDQQLFLIDPSSPGPRTRHRGGAHGRAGRLPYLAASSRLGRPTGAGW